MGPETIGTLMHHAWIMGASVVSVCSAALSRLECSADRNALTTLAYGLWYLFRTGVSDGDDGPTRGGCAARNGGISAEVVGHRGQSSGNEEGWLEQLRMPPFMVEDHLLPDVIPRTGWIEARLGVRILGFGLFVLTRGVLTMPGEPFCPGPHVRLVDERPGCCPEITKQGADVICILEEQAHINYA